MRISDWSSDVCSSDLGGDEFAVALDVDEPQALEIAESIRRRVGELSFVAAPGLRCTVSLGVASASPGMSLRRWMAAADSALYGAKDQGRDRVATPGRNPHIAAASRREAAHRTAEPTSELK